MQTARLTVDPSVKELGARVRIAKKANEIESPTGMAFSGEVEDFKTQITHPPKGELRKLLVLKLLNKQQQ